MSGILGHALATPGLGFLLIGVVLAGLVRGFAGFGTAMVYLPFAGQVLSPVAALVTLVVMNIIGPLVNVPRAWHNGRPGEIARLALGALITLPLGVAVLEWMAPQDFRYVVSLLTLMLLALMLSGWRYHGVVSRAMLYVTGAVGGFLAGVAGLPGPPVILLYMASRNPPAVIRANTLIYLIATSAMMLMVFWGGGLLSPAPIMLGLVLAVPYLLANIAGAALFDPKRVALYRAVGYIIIAGSALSGLPLLD